MTQTAVSGYAIRDACPADIPAIREMRERSMWVLGGDFYSAGEMAGFLAEVGMMDDAIVHDGRYFVAENDCGAILGGGGWTRSGRDYADALPAAAKAGGPFVRGVFVNPAATRRGIGTAIMVRVEQDAVEHGVSALHLTATLPGAALYAGLGYRTVYSTRLTLRNDIRFACVGMSKQLRKSGELAA